MKNIFTEEELQVGMFLIKNNVSKPFTDKSFARTVTWKVGFVHENGKQFYGLCNILTDGF